MFNRILGTFIAFIGKSASPQVVVDKMDEYEPLDLSCPARFECPDQATADWLMELPD